MKCDQGRLFSFYLSLNFADNHSDSFKMAPRQSQHTNKSQQFLFIKQKSFLFQYINDPL